jgi:hypothetical protein
VEGFSVEQIQLIGDGIAICMCAATVLLLVRLRAKWRRGSPIRGSGGNNKDFNQELRRLVKAGTKPLAGVQGLEPSDRSVVEDRVTLDDRGPHETSGPLQDPSQSLEMVRDSEDAPIKDRYGQVKRLAGMGLDKEEIFKRVGLPKGEIELVLKLNRLNAETRENLRPGHSVLA